MDRGRELRFRRRGGNRWEPEFGVELPGGHVAKPIAVREEASYDEFTVDSFSPVKHMRVARRPELGDELQVRGMRRHYDRASAELDLGDLKVEVALEDLEQTNASGHAVVRLVPAKWWIDDASDELLVMNDRPSTGWRGRTRSELAALTVLDELVEETCALAR